MPAVMRSSHSQSPRSSSSTSRIKVSPVTAHTSLASKRKHRKMLKDGTSEVWPEAVEKIFMEGLRQYWDSPWATFSSGRSRWRNAYLVEYLQKAGVTRTKKQVASHIQVLRNMLKGEPEFQLVAGADDLEEIESAGSKGCSPSRQASDSDGDSERAYPVSPSTPGSTSSFDDHLRLTSTEAAGAGAGGGHALAAAAAAGIAPPHVKAEDVSDFLSIGAIAPAIQQQHPHGASPSAYVSSTLYPHARTPAMTVPRLTVVGRRSSAAPQPPSPLGLHSPDSPSDLSAAAAGFTAPASHYPASSRTGSGGSAVKAEPGTSPEEGTLLRAGSSPTGATPAAGSAAWFAQPRTVPARNRLRSLSCWAEGMTPVGVNVDQLAASTSPAAPHAGAPARTLLRIRLTVPTFDDARCPPTLQGVSAAISLAAPWAVSASCQTVVHVGGVCTSDEIEQLSPSSIANDGGAAAAGGVLVCLPQSALSRCRWFEAGTAPTSISQKIVVDGEPLALISYQLDLTSTSVSGGPTAELVAFKWWPSQSFAPLPPPPQAQHPAAPQPHHAHHQHQHHRGFIAPGADSSSFALAASPTAGGATSPVSSGVPCAYSPGHGASSAMAGVGPFSHLTPSSAPFCQ